MNGGRMIKRKKRKREAKNRCRTDMAHGARDANLKVCAQSNQHHSFFDVVGGVGRHFSGITFFPVFQ